MVSGQHLPPALSRLYVFPSFSAREVSVAGRMPAASQ
jgi:hypothetical protein